MQTPGAVCTRRRNLCLPYPVIGIFPPPMFYTWGLDSPSHLRITANHHEGVWPDDVHDLIDKTLPLLVASYQHRLRVALRAGLARSAHAWPVRGYNVASLKEVSRPFPKASD